MSCDLSQQARLPDACLTAYQDHSAAARGGQVEDMVDGIQNFVPTDKWRLLAV